MSDAPERIWLLGIGGPEPTWCTDPNPSGSPEELAEAVEYVRADTRQADPGVGEMREALEPFLDYARKLDFRDNENDRIALGTAGEYRRLLTAALRIQKD